MDESLVLAVDLGGTWMRAAAVDADGEVVHRCAKPTPHDAGGVDALVDLATEVVDAYPIDRAVVGVPGRVDYRDGRLEHAPNLPSHWTGELGERVLADRLGVTVDLANDADLAAVGEAYAGAGRGVDDVVYLTVSTGVGAGVLLDRRLVAGRRSLADVGHTVVDLRADRDGEPATLEDLGSGAALERRAAEAGLPADGRRVTELVVDGDDTARRVWAEIVAVIAVGVRNLAYLFAPDAIVLGGGLGRTGELLLDPLRDRLAASGPPGRDAPIALRPAELGDDAGLAGAAAWRRATGKEPR